MDLVLLTLAIISLAAAAGFGIVAWSTLAGQRRRSAARVAALASALDVGSAHASPDAGTGLSVAPKPRTTEGGRRHVDPQASAAADGRVAMRPDETVLAGRSAVADRPGETSPKREREGGPVAVSSMFGTTPGGSVRGRPVIKAAVAASMAIVLIVVVAMANRTHPVSTVRGDEPSPLELVSMRHTRDGGALTVTGLVRNPRTGSPQARIAAVVFAFDRDGGFLASARAPLDFTTLGPGDESPFVVTLPDAGDVGRYRVSFRTDESVVRHVDRRATHVGGRADAHRVSEGGERQSSAN